MKPKTKIEEGAKFFTKTDRGNRNTKLIDRKTKNIDRRTNGENRNTKIIGNLDEEYRQTEASETINTQIKK